MIVRANDPYIQYQIQARKNPSVIKLKILNYRSRYPAGLLLAVEGDDDKIVYSQWISQVSPELSYEFFVCGGKRAIRQLSNSIGLDRGSMGRDILLFVDRDFDDTFGFTWTKKLFMLDKYSIENYVVASSILDASIKLAFPGSGDPSSRSKICQIFDEDYSRFLIVSAEINKRIFVARRLELDIDDLIPKLLSLIAGVQIGNVVPGDLPPDRALPYPQQPDAKRESDLHGEFALLSPPDRYRGKFAIKFFRHWLDRLADEYRNPKLGLFLQFDRGDGKIKHDELSLGALAARSSIPESLKLFLGRELS